jgi:hypothetical protein
MQVAARAANTSRPSGNWTGQVCKRIPNVLYTRCWDVGMNGLKSGSSESWQVAAGVGAGCGVGSALDRPSSGIAGAGPSSGTAGAGVD